MTAKANKDDNIKRIIFQPTERNASLIKKLQGFNEHMSQSDLCNYLIADSQKPRKRELLDIYERLIIQTNTIRSAGANSEDMDYYIRHALVDAVEILAHNPIENVEIFDQIAFIFRNKREQFRYDFPFTMSHDDDELMHQLNEVLLTIDKDFNGYTREFAEKYKYIRKNWKELRQYSATYKALSIMIKYDRPGIFDLDEVIIILCELDKALINSNIEIIGEQYPINITNLERAKALRYEILTYYTDNALAKIAPKSYWDGNRSKEAVELYKIYHHELDSYHESLMNEDEYYNKLKDIYKKANYALEVEYGRKQYGEGE